MITYTDSLADVTVEHLQGGFFVGWPNPPSPQTHYRILANSSAIILARIADGTVVGFITAVSDQLSCAYIPHLEVLPAYQGQGIGSELVRQMLEKLRHLYMIDLVCDPALQPFYERFGMRPVVGMVKRNYDRQAGDPLVGVQLKHTHEEISKMNAEHEQRVIERTAELTAMNEQLRREIAERERAEALIQAKEEEFRAIVENTPDQIIRYDRNLNRIYVNPAVFKDYDLPKEVFIGKPIGSIVADAQLVIDNEEVDAQRRRIQAVFDTGEPIESEVTWPLPGGRRTFSSRLVPEFDPNGEVISVLGIARDITERNRAEEALRKSERVLREAEVLGHTGSWEQDLITGEIFNTEENLRLFFGDDRTKGADFEDYVQVVHPDDREYVMRRRAALLEEEGPSDIEYRVVWPDGSVHVIFGRATVIRNELGQPIRLYGTNVDITERKQTEDELRTQKEILQKIFDHTPMMIGMIGADGQWQMINRAWERTIGWTLEELQQSNFDVLAEVYPDPAERQRVLDFIAAKSGKWEEFKARTRDGRELDVMFTNVYLSDGTTLGFGLDLTERKQAETTIRSLLQISEKLTATLDIDALLDSLVIEAMKLINAEIGWSGLHTEEGMVCHTHIGRDLQVIPFKYSWPPGIGLPGWVLVHKVPYVMNDAQSDHFLIPEIRERFGVKNAIDTPILDTQGEVIGFFEVNNKKNEARFTESDVEKLVAVSRIASISLQNAMSYTKLERTEGELQKQAARAETLTRIAARLNQQLDLEAVVHAVCQEVVDTFKASQATMSLYDKKQDLLVYAGGVNIPPEYAAKIEPISRTQFEEFVRTMGPIMVVPDIQALPNVPNAEFSARFDVRTVVTADVRRDKELIGVLALGVNGHIREFDQDELTLIKAISDQAAQAIANALLLKAANEQHEQLRVLSTKLVEVQETERRAIATELHDRVGQNLTGLSINLQNMKALLSVESAQKLVAKFDDAQTLVEDTTRQIRNIMAALYLPELEDYGLAAALETYAERATSRGNLELITSLPDLAPPNLPSEVRIALFRAAQEAISNVLKHANASQLRIGLEERDSRIRLMVEDDGQGFEPEEASQKEALSWGLKIMRERIESIGGEVQIDSGPGQGTRVTFEIERPS